MLVCIMFAQIKIFELHTLIIISILEFLVRNFPNIHGAHCLINVRIL